MGCRNTILIRLWVGLSACCMLLIARAAAEVPGSRERAPLWSFQPLTSPQPPQPAHSVWGNNAIDAFILRTLESRNLKPAPPADRRALIRRATFDLLGLPPTPQDVEAFVKDRSTNAFATVVDRLLASPHYGERWGRHWLDVVRYADSNGLDENVAFGNAWRYRDYVIQAFNQDKPFNQFVIEQLAGDLLPHSPDTEERIEHLTALGFLCLGPKLLAEPDKVKLEMDLIDEQIETLGRAFLGTSLGCARCHDHKFDPISTEDYYALAAIFKSTQTMDDLKTIAKWHEPVVARPLDREIQKAHEQRIATQRLAITNFVTQANNSLLTNGTFKTLPPEPEKAYSSNLLATLENLRSQLKSLETNAPEVPVTMGVTESATLVKTLPVHLRGSHLSLGKPVSRGVPKAMIHSGTPAMSEHQSGRLELARWIADPEHPLTGRVIVNRLWRWHFGRGLVGSTDNFGSLGDRPTHPELLDWLARRFAQEGWSFKAMHRLIMLSSTYQMSSQDSLTPASEDPENHYLSHFSMRRLEAEEIRDSLLAVSGMLDLTMGGKTIPLKNREFVFDHTSKDNTRYDSLRRAVYLPVIRNHLYDLFEQFDYPDPAVPNGNRSATVVAPQALLMMNSELVIQASRHLAEQLLATHGRRERPALQEAYLRAYGRPATQKELGRARSFLAGFARIDARSDADPVQAWAALCQTLLAANEFIYLH